MSPELLPIIVFPALFAAVAYSIKVVSDNRTRRQLIAAGCTKESIDALFARTPTDYERARRNGYVALGIGLAFMIIGLAKLGASDPLSYALLGLSSGAALILYARSQPAA